MLKQAIFTLLILAGFVVVGGIGFILYDAVASL